mgnify:CR=1 FL=1
MRIDPVSLQLFVAVVETGSIAAASEREHLAAAAVSRRRNVDAPAPPNTEPALDPPNAPPMPPPLPCCSSTVSMRNKHTTTCRIVTRVDIGGVV